MSEPCSSNYASPTLGYGCGQTQREIWSCEAVGNRRSHLRGYSPRKRNLCALAGIKTCYRTLPLQPPRNGVPDRAVSRNLDAAGYSEAG